MDGYDAFSAGVEPGGLRNRNEIKVLIAFLLKNTERGLSRRQLMEVIQREGLANYFEASQALESLIEGGSVEPENPDGPPIPYQIDGDPGGTLPVRISILRHRVLMQAFEEAGYPQPQATQMADVCFEAFIHARHQFTIFPEAEPMLQALRQHFLLGVITNGNADVRRLGLADYFQATVTKEQVVRPRLYSRLIVEATSSLSLSRRSAK